MSVNCRFLNHTLLTIILPIDSRILTVCILQDERGDIEPMAEYFAPPRDHKEVKTFLFFYYFGLFGPVGVRRYTVPIGQCCGSRSLLISWIWIQLLAVTENYYQMR